MSRHLISPLIASLLLFFVLPVTIYAAGRKTIYVATDMHVMDSSLIVSEGEALAFTFAHDRKMLRHSTEAFEAFVDSAIIHHADVLLLSGDLTKDGERVSHEHVARTLEKARKAGVECYVIPGNHDISNSNACYYDGDRTYPAESVTVQEFADIYRHFGYDDTIVRDPHSLSYVCEPVSGLVLLCIDASIYGDVLNKGVIGRPTLEWILKQIDDAKARGKQVFAMMHQQLADHVDGLNDMMDTFAIKDADDIACLLAEHGVHLVFTGHTHYSDAATIWNDKHTASLTDVTTGSIITYPSYYRVLTVSGDGSCLTIDSHRITTLPSQPDYTRYGRQFMENNLYTFFYTVSSIYWESINSLMKRYCKDIHLLFTSITFRLPKTPEELVDLVFRYLESFIIKGFTIVYEGNEHHQDAYENMYKELKRGVYNILGEIIENDIYVLGRPMARRKACDMVMEEVMSMMKSILEDLNYIGTAHENRTDDLHFNIDLQTGRMLTDAEFENRMEKTVEQPITIRTSRGHIRVEGAINVSIYNLQGQIVSNCNEVFVPTGSYIVHADDQIKKIRVR